MRRLILGFSFFVYAIITSAQITIESNTLPDIGDELEYTNLILSQDSLTTFKETGENRIWTFNEFDLGGQMLETYQDINTTTLADSFPDSDMIVTLGLFTAAARREANRITINGINTEGFGGFEIDASLQLSSDYTIRETPLSFGTINSDDADVIFTFDAGLIPFLDSIDLMGLPGAIDSIRVTTSLSREEEVVGWGTVNVMDQSREVLQVREENFTDIILEVGIDLAGFLLWFDVTDLIAMAGAGGGGQSSTTYRFLEADSKLSVIEFTENIFADSLGNNMQILTARTGLELDISSTDDVSLFDPLSIDVFPNPTSDVVTIKVNNYNQEVDVEIYNSVGQKVGQWANLANGSMLDVTQINNGHYIIVAHTDDRELRGTLIIER